MALCSTALIPNAVAAPSVIATVIAIPTDCLTVGMITSVRPIHCHHLVLLKASPECELVHTRPRALLTLFVLPPRNNSEDFDAYAAANPAR